MCLVNGNIQSAALNPPWDTSIILKICVPVINWTLYKGLSVCEQADPGS